MIDQTRIAGELVSKLGNQLLNESRAERDAALEEIRDSQQLQHLQDVADEERLSQKVENAVNNDRVQDQVHISERAQAMYRAREEGAEGTAEKIHTRRQDKGEEPGLTPEATAFEPFVPGT